MIRASLPRSLFGRLAVILLAAITLALAIAAQFLGMERGPMQGERLAGQAVQRIALAETVFAHADPAARPSVRQALAAAGLSLVAAADDPAPGARDETLGRIVARELRQRLRGIEVLAVEVHADDAGNARFVALLRSPAGEQRRWMTLEKPDRPLPPPRFLWPTLVALLVLVGVGALLAVRWVTRPLSALAAAARALGTGSVGPRLLERGPTEARQTARAFNDMSQRIGSMMDEKARMLAAISHDLRAPITRMRLRVEMMTDEVVRARLIRDLDELRRLTDEALEFLRGSVGGEPSRRCDLVQVAATVVQDARDAGGDVVLSGAASLWLQGRPGALRRCVQNLLDNALKHAGAAEIEVGRSGADAGLWVRDRGPGMSGEAFERAFEPFFRGDPARGHASGFGLGLPIARAIAREHGGELTLALRPGGGLVAWLRLPALGEGVDQLPLSEGRASL